jgi:hypothetical protein
MPVTFWLPFRGLNLKKPIQFNLWYHQMTYRWMTPNQPAINKPAKRNWRNAAKVRAGFLNHVCAAVWRRQLTYRLAYLLCAHLAVSLRLRTPHLLWEWKRRMMLTFALQGTHRRFISPPGDKA